MRKVKYIIGQLISYKGKMHKITGMRFTTGGVMYKLDEIKEWIEEKEVTAQARLQKSN